MPSAHPDVLQGTPDKATIDEITAILIGLGDSRDADAFNGQFANDVLWGNPRGGFLDSYAAVHNVHSRFFAAGGGAPLSRFTPVNMRTYGRDVAIVQIIRETLEANGEVMAETSDPAAFVHEAALFVFVRADGKWWLAAGQNTPLRPLSFSFEPASPPLPGTV